MEVTMRTLSSEDAFFLYLETPDQHQHVVGTMILDPATAPGGIDLDALIEKYESDLRIRPEFRQRLVKTPFSMTPPVLVDDPYFVFRNHIHRIAVPPPGTLKELATIVEDIASTALSHRRPLWECWFISGLANGRLAVVFKSHHCLADGVHGAEFMDQLFDDKPVPATRKQTGEDQPPPRKTPLWSITYHALLDQWRYQPRSLDVLKRTLSSVRHRRQLFTESRSLRNLVPAFFESAPKLKFNAPITSNRTAAMDSVSLNEVKRIKNELGITVNDVVVAACTLALREYLIATDDLPDRPLVAYLPVSLALKGMHSRKPDQGNEVGTMAVHLPVHIDDTTELVREVCRSTSAAKTVFNQSFENLLQSYIGVVPSTVADWGLKHYLNRHVIKYAPTTANVVISNFPGPSRPLYLAGALLEESYVMGPIISGQGPNITFMSYIDKIQFSVQACRDHVSDIWMLADGIKKGFAQLGQLTQLSEAAPASTKKSAKTDKKRKKKTAKKASK